MSELPFDYHKTKAWLGSKHNVQSDPSYDDRYHDCLEKFLRVYDGSVHPLTALNQYYLNWYRDTQYRKELQWVGSVEDLISFAQINIEAGDEGDAYVADRYGYYQPDNAHAEYLHNEVRSVLSNLTEYQRDVLVRRMNDESFQEIADSYGVTHQAVQNVYRKVSRQLLDILV